MAALFKLLGPNTDGKVERAAFVDKFALFDAALPNPMIPALKATMASRGVAAKAASQVLESKLSC